MNYRGPRLTVEDFAQIASTAVRTGSTLRAPVFESIPKSEPAPVVVGSGPVAWSTSVMMERWPTVVYDTNGYYASLGVTPWATRDDLRRAYVSKGGEASPRLTYIMSQLLDPEVRRAYDSTPIGSFYYDDYVETQTRIEAADRVTQLLLQGASYEDLQEADPAELAGMEWRQSQDVPDSDWGGWSYYRWGSWGGDEANLTRWRHLLIRRLQRTSGLTRPVGVGYCGFVPGGVRVALLKGVPVIFLSEDAKPTRRLAKRAIRDIHKLLK